MIHSFSSNQVTTVDGQLRINRLYSILGALCLLGITGLVALLTLRRGPDPATPAWLLFYGGLGLVLYRPRFGIYIIIFFTLMADMSLMYWYPFVKNFSSWESLFYVHNALIINPLEIYIVATFLSWFARPIIERKPLRFSTRGLFWPIIIFICFISYGLIYGLIKGGNLTIALWEVRAIYYLPALFILVTNLIEDRSQVSRIVWIAASALFVKACVGTSYIANELNFAIGSVDRIAEHSMSIQFDAFFVLLVSSLLFKAPASRRLIMPLMAPVVLLSYLGNNRRSSFIALALALLLIGIALFWQNRRLFWYITPIFVVFSIVYLIIFWTNESALGLPANAIRSVFGAPDARDASSNYYRFLENLNISYTIKSAPFTGVGFGNKFFIVASMADISVFVFWEYITHNSILYIWMKAGVGAFLSMMFMLGMSLFTGVRTFRAMPDGELRTIALTATTYVAMHFLFSYVDMSWDSISMVLMGVMMAFISNLPTLAARPVPVTPARWPWQEKTRSGHYNYGSH